MMKDIIVVNTAVVFLKLKQDKEISFDNVTTLQVVNSGFVTVFVNDFEIASKEKITLVPPDGTTSKVELNIRFATDTDTTEKFSGFTWNKKEIDIIYKKFIKC
ncbi:hypothetical protein [Flavobacterium sp. ABG]|uniref:hypothetical protein n=1 Tax=Flavobacterium sp. ABG TaxID=1423322 RepID=UPI000A7B6516|nr:hypothetical protein [Flavobacterium sp. ABG]